MNRGVVSVTVGGACLMSLVLMAVVSGHGKHDDDRDSRVRRGFRINPVRLNLEGKDRELVGLGSYLVNAVGGCNDCHTCPSYKPGHNPYGPPFGPSGGGDGAVNDAAYLAGGVPFFPPGVISANLTPDPAEHNRPEGHTFKEFAQMMRTGHDVEEDRILQVMPWPVYRNMTDEDLRAIYEYLRAIPHRETPPPNTCVAPGQ